ncbi:MAG: hypothetical protein GXY67_08270 [Clostridiales bacterium]|nr:hypothetical protein [Clostridiales bacterium]
MDRIRIELAKEKLKLERLVAQALAKGLHLTGTDILEQSKKVDLLLNKVQADSSNIIDIRSYRRLSPIQRPTTHDAAPCRILPFDPNRASRPQKTADGKMPPVSPSMVKK